MLLKLANDGGDLDHFGQMSVREPGPIANMDQGLGDANLGQLEWDTQQQLEIVEANHQNLAADLPEMLDPVVEVYGAEPEKPETAKTLI